MAEGDDLPPSRNSGVPNIRQYSERTKNLWGMMIGSVMIYGGFFGSYYFWNTISDRRLSDVGDFVLVGIGTILIITVFYVGGRIVLASTRIRADVIPALDRPLLEPLITDSNEKAIELYIRLSSLAGLTGTATRLGLTGLPLLTVALTLIFCGLHLYNDKANFMDLAKLTLGAFIGSFVQRTATNQAIVSSGGRPPTEIDS